MAQGLNGDSGERRRTGLKAHMRAAQEGLGSAQVAAAEMMEGRGGLDEGLEKALLGLAEGEPD